MWYPRSTYPTDNSHRVYTDEEMVMFFLKGLDNGWTVKKNEDGTVSAYKDGNHIRDYVQR